MYPLEVQKFIKRYPQAWKQMQAAAREIVTPKPDSKGPITIEEWSRLEKLEAAIQSKHNIPNKEFAAIRKVWGVPPKYRMAYEEAAVRPLPPSWKRIFLVALTETADSASAPVLGRLCRQAMDSRVISNRERRSVLSRIGRALIATPSRATLLEISSTVQYEKSRDPKSQHYFTGIVGYNLAEPKSNWSRLLDEIGSEKATAEHVRRLREVMQPYVEYFKKKAASASSKPAGAKGE
jgi:hypothetical protein